MDGELLATVGPGIARYTINRVAAVAKDQPTYSVRAVRNDGSSSPIVEQYFAIGPIADDFSDFGNNRVPALQQPIANASVDVYGPDVVELFWDARPTDFLVYRDNKITGALNGNSFLDRELQPAETYTWYVTRNPSSNVVSSNRDVLVDGYACLVECRPVDVSYIAQGRSERVSAQTQQSTTDNTVTEPETVSPEIVEPPVTGPGNPDAPAGLRALLYSETAGEIFWLRSNDDVGVVGYEVRRNGALLSTRDATSFYDDTRTAGTSYSYTVRAIDTDGNFSAPSEVNAQSDADSEMDPDSSPDIEAPGPISGLRSIVYSATAVELFWDRSTVSGLEYEVYRNARLIGSSKGVSFFDSQFSRTLGAFYELVAIDPGTGSRSPRAFTQIEATAN